MNPRPLLLLVLACLLAGGCAVLPPMYIECSGKGAITGTGALQMGAVYGGGGVNTGTLQADCGDGFRYYRGPAPDVAPPKP